MDQGCSAIEHGPPPPATGSFALDLSREGITLYWLSSHGVWNAVEHVVLQDGHVAERMGQLRARIGGLPDAARVDVWLPEDQVIVRVLDTGGALPTEAMVAGLFADASEALEFDAETRPGATVCTLSAIPRSVLEQTRDFLRPFGFEVDTYTVRHAPAGMDNAPAFLLDPPAAAPLRATPPRAALAAAGAGLLLGGGLLASVLLGAFGDPAPKTPLVKIEGPAGAGPAEASVRAPAAAVDGAGRVADAAGIGSADRLASVAAPANPQAVGPAQTGLTLPPEPALAETAGPVPQSGALPPRGARPQLAPVAGDGPRAPAIYARPVQTAVAAPTPPEEPADAPPPAARAWTRHAVALPAGWLSPAADAGAAPDMAALREVPLPAALVVDPAQAGVAEAVAPPPVPPVLSVAHVAAFLSELAAPSAAPAAADMAGARTRPADVATPIMATLAMPDAAGDPAATAPRPEAAMPRPAATAAPAAMERSAPLADFARSDPAARPVRGAVVAHAAIPAAGSAPAELAGGQAALPPAQDGIAALGTPSGPLPAADPDAARAPADVRVAIDWLPVQPGPGPLTGPPPPPAGESALNAMLLDILGAASGEMPAPLVEGADGGPRARVAVEGTRPDPAEPARVAALTQAPPAGTTGLSVPAEAAQPLDMVTPRAADTHDELASLLSPSDGVQIGRVPDPRQGQPRAGALPQIEPAPSRPALGDAATLPDKAVPAPAPEPVEVAALAVASDLPRAQVAPAGTVPALPDIEFAALDRGPTAGDDRPDAAHGPAMPAPSDAPGAVSVPLPALPTAEDGTGVAVAVIEARPDIVPPLRPRPQVIEARPEIVPPLREAPADGTRVAALAAEVDPAPETVDDGSDLALPSRIRPRPRPPAIETAAAAAAEEATQLASLAPSELALNRTDSPRRRPSDLASVRPDPAPAAAAPAPAASAPEPKRAMPDLPTTASVARAATIRNALPFGRMSLIGVFGSDRNRHAILRLRSGDFVKVQNGDSVEGYQITGMSSNAVRLRRGGRETVLVIPQ